MGEMAQWVKALATMSDNLNSIPQNPHDRRKKEMTLSCRHQKRVSDSLSVELQAVVNHLIKMIRTKVWFSAKAARAL